MGASYNYPENNCCSCGKDKSPITKTYNAYSISSTFTTSSSGDTSGCGTPTFTFTGNPTWITLTAPAGDPTLTI